MAKPQHTEEQSKNQKMQDDHKVHARKGVGL